MLTFAESIIFSLMAWYSLPLLNKLFQIFKLANIIPRAAKIHKTGIVEAQHEVIG